MTRGERTRCTHEMPAIRPGEPSTVCGERAAPGASLCSLHATQALKQKAEQRLALARASGSENEAQSAATAAVLLMAQHKFVFFPKTAMIERAVAVYSAAKDDTPERRAAALGVARASVGSQVLTFEERKLILEAEDEARAVRLAADSRKQAIDTIDSGRSWVEAAFGVARDILNGVETRDGRPVMDRAAEIQQELRVIDQRLADFHRVIVSGASAKRTGKRPKVSKPGAAKATKATKVPRKRASPRTPR